MMSDAATICNFVDDVIDEYSKTKKKVRVNFFKYLESENIDRKSINEYVTDYSPLVSQQISELDGAITGDKILTEAYGHLKKSELREFKSMLDRFLDDVNKYKDSKRITRRKKQKSPDQLVKGLHLIEDSVIVNGDEYMPIHKTEIIDAKSIFLLNVKTKDLLFLSGKRLSCSGAKIIGFDPNISGLKKLKKVTESINSVKTSSNLTCLKIFQTLPNKRRQSPKTVSPNYLLLKVLI